MHSSPQPLRFDVNVPPNDRITVQLPLPAAPQVTVYVVEGKDAKFDELLDASVSSTEFWDNPEDDEDWSDA